MNKSVFFVAIVVIVFFSLFSQYRCKHGDNRTQTVLIVWTDKNVGYSTIFVLLENAHTHSRTQPDRPTTLGELARKIYSQTHGWFQFLSPRSGSQYQMRRQWQTKWYSSNHKWWCFDILILVPHIQTDTLMHTSIQICSFCRMHNLEKKTEIQLTEQVK